MTSTSTTTRWPTTFPAPTPPNSAARDVSAEDAGLDPRYLVDLLQRDANPADLIDQAIIVPIPDDDRGLDSAD